MAQPALAATWPMSTSALSATLAFHQSYSAGSNSYVHSGIDIPASAGLQIILPLAGTVRFTGAVPSGDSRTGGTSSDKTMNAVSIELSDGRTVTLMPFASIDVREGQTVAEGAPLGTLAASGDVSTSATHLHMGYKQGSRYLDPMLLFGMAGDAPGGAAAAQSAAEVPGASASTPLASAEAAPSVGESASPSAHLEQPGIISVPEELTITSSESFGAIETGRLRAHAAGRSCTSRLSRGCARLARRCMHGSVRGDGRGALRRLVQQGNGPRCSACGNGRASPRVRCLCQASLVAAARSFAYLERFLVIARWRW